MGMQVAKFEDIQHLIKTGDQLLVGTYTNPSKPLMRLLSRLINKNTDSDQSHAAPIVSMSMVPTELDYYEYVLWDQVQDKSNLLFCPEALWPTMKWSLMEHSIDHWEDVWVLPLRRDLYDRLDHIAYTNWLFDVCKEKVPYDIMNLIIYWLGKVPPEDLEKLYCSETCGAALKKGGVYDGTTSLTPAQVGQISIYDDDYYYIGVGTPKKIKGYNSGILSMSARPTCMSREDIRCYKAYVRLAKRISKLCGDKDG